MADGTNVKYFELSDQEEVKKLLSHIEVSDVERGIVYKKAELCTVEFHYADGSVVETKFIKPTQLERKNHGQLYLRDAKFYDEICAVISKFEGRTVDPLRKR